MRPIDADAIEYHTMAKEDWLGCTVEDSEMVWKVDIDTMPTVDAVPVRHGKWITKSTGGEYFDCCSECGYVEWDAPNKYCPNCGAIMGAERKEE